MKGTAKVNMKVPGPVPGRDFPDRLLDARPRPNQGGAAGPRADRGRPARRCSPEGVVEEGRPSRLPERDPAQGAEFIRGGGDFDQSIPTGAAGAPNAVNKIITLIKQPMKRETTGNK